MEKTKRLEGKVISVKLTGLKHDTGGHKSREIPYVKFSIKNGSGKRESCEMPIDIGDGQLIKGAMLGQTIIFKEEDYYLPGYHYSTKKISIKSGPCAGAKYELIEAF